MQGPRSQIKETGIAV